MESAAPPRRRVRVQRLARVRQLALQQPSARLAAQGEQGQARLRPVLNHQPRRAGHLRQHRVQLRAGRTPRHLQALAVAKRGHRQAEKHEARQAHRTKFPHLVRAGTLDLVRKTSGLSSPQKGTVAHASRAPNLGNLGPTSPPQRKRRRERVIRRNQASAKPAVRPNNLISNNESSDLFLLGNPSEC